MQTTEDSVKIAVLEQKLFEVTNNISKLNDAIEKISEANTNLIKMLAVHEQKIEQCSKTDSLIIKMVEEIETSLTNDYKRTEQRIEKIEIDVSERVSKIDTRLDDIIKVKWMTVGIGCVLVVMTGLLSPLVSNWVDRSLTTSSSQEEVRRDP
jgi:ElaB/YqjD/DUF883 family membrane-anchored ribosome-binding protein